MFCKDRITGAREMIANTVVDKDNKIRDDDVILVYAASSCVEHVLLRAVERRRRFRVIVVDSNPRFEGRGLAARLMARGVHCTYTLLNGVSYVMPRVSKVFLGAHAMGLNGALMSRCGTAVVAMCAHHLMVPVLVLCEVYKFSQRVQIDAISFNELGNPDDLVAPRRRLEQADDPVAAWHSIPTLSMLNLMYDVTPPKYIDAVVCDAGIIPATSIPAILREWAARELIAETGTEIN